MIEPKKFIGCKVNHKTWGEGIIKRFGNSSLTAHFLKTNTGERSVGFQFPQAFADGFLFFTDQMLQKEISQLIQESKCCFCNTIGIQTEIIDGIPHFRIVIIFDLAAGRYHRCRKVEFKKGKKNAFYFLCLGRLQCLPV